MSDNPAVNAPSAVAPAPVISPVPVGAAIDPAITDPAIAIEPGTAPAVAVVPPSAAVEPAISLPAVIAPTTAATPGSVAEPGTSPIATQYAARVEQAKTETGHPGHHSLFAEMYADLLRLEHAAARHV